MRLRALQILVLGVLVALWHVFTAPGLIPNFYFEQDNRAAFFFGEPAQVFWVIVDWFTTGEIFRHLAFTLLETVLGFAIGAVFGLGIGLWLALSDTASAVMEPYIKGFNSMPRVVLAPIFAVWFGLGIWSKVALGVTLVFFVVFFNVYQGVREVSPNLIDNARMLGASPRQLLRSIYLPSAMSWGRRRGRRVSGVRPGRRLPDPAGRGYLRHQHRVRRHHRPDRFRPGARRHRGRHRAPPDDLAAPGQRDREGLAQRKRHSRAFPWAIAKSASRVRSLAMHRDI